MTALLPDVDPDGLLEFSVVFTDRSLNHMSATFQGVMNELSSSLQSVYGADAVAIVPGGGTYGMEAVARQFACQRDVVLGALDAVRSHRADRVFTATRDQVVVVVPRIELGRAEVAP